MKSFDLINTPLDGSHLLEAGAGTGKTFSLSFLYLRLLLEKQLRVEEIVVATFTNAATAELKQRIYARLFEAETALTQLIKHQQSPETTPCDSNDPLIILLTRLRSTISDDELHKRLRLAQAQFDRAHIHSINGFALQLLHEHAVTLGQTIPEEIANDDNELIKNCYLELAHDNFAELGEHASAVGKVVASMSSDELFALLTSMHEHYDALRNAEEKFPNVGVAIEEFDNTVAHIRDDKTERDCAIESIISALDAGYVSKASYKLDKINSLRAQLDHESSYQADKIVAFALFTAQKLNASLVKKGKDAGISFQHPVFSAFERAIELAPIVAQKQHIEFYHCLMRLLDVIRTHLDAEKADSMTMTHDDVVSVVADGADKLRLPFKAALLDEAQDTNSAQLSIFTKLFLQRGHICFFVGDPKQAIYGFRGGDVYTYLAIRDSVAHTHRLPKNYRSTHALNDSVNDLFAHNPFASEGIDYRDIDWDKSNDESDFGATSLSLLPSPSKSVDDITATAANRIVELLGEGRIIGKDGEKRPLSSGDIAILVRSQGQAERMKAALAERGLAASYTGRKSIYSSDEALLMHALLQAISSGHVRAVKSLMLTVLFDYGSDDVLDDDCVNSLRQYLHHCASVYTQRGFATMFYRFMHDFNVGGRLLQLADGKRRLSNWIQLFELLQQALQGQSLTLLGLNDWLLHAIREHEKDETPFRLEDKNAVSIMTIHSSKGLEFSVVCLPYFHYQPSQRGGSADSVIVSQQKRLAILSRLKIDEITQLCERERMAEDMRLAYVALTRATFQNIIVEQPVSGQNKSRDASLWARLLHNRETAIAQQDFCEMREIGNGDMIMFQAPPSPTLNIRELPETLRPKWLMTSFSGLQQRMSHTDTSDFPTPTLSAGNNAGRENYTEKEPSALLRFPAGARAGVVLHTLYEHYMQTRRCDDEFIDVVGEQLNLSKLPLAGSVAEVAPELARNIAETATIPLAPHKFCLNDIAVEQQSIEMAFFLHLSPQQRQHLYQHFGESIAADIDGYLHGFIDYCFCYDGKFYVLDYKSNKLGDAQSDYHQQAMQQAMDEHHYELQALIYTLALCKHLGIDNEADYERIGGYYYLFIRGMDDELYPHVENSTTNTASGIYYNAVSWDMLAPLLIVK